MDDDITIGCPDHGDFLSTPLNTYKVLGVQYVGMKK